MKTCIYFDYNATTRLEESVKESMLPFLGEVYGNPSSIHRLGRAARAELDEARGRVAELWRCRPSEVVFTSGGTESVNLALFGTARHMSHRGRHLITTGIEHPCVQGAMRWLEQHEGFSVTRLPVDRLGRVDPESLTTAIREDTILVSIMAANNETGVIQPVDALGAICRERKVLFHTDAVQWFGKLPVESIHQFNADLVSVCAHKFHGPKGAGALFIRSPLLPEPILFGGSHENERRAGTENLAGIVGLVTAMEQFVRIPVFDPEPLRRLTSRLEEALRPLDRVLVHRHPEHCLANTLTFSVEGTDSTALLATLDLEGICASSGSACSSGSLEPSQVLLAMGFGPERARAIVRLSLGKDSSAEEVEQVCGLLPRLLGRLRKA